MFDYIGTNPCHPNICASIQTLDIIIHKGQKPMKSMTERVSELVPIAV